MAVRKDLRHADEVRAKIQTSQLVNRLHDNTFGTIEMTQGQLKSAEILLRKSLPDLASVTIGGDADNPLVVLSGYRESLGTKLGRIADVGTAPTAQDRLN